MTESSCRYRLARISHQIPSPSLGLCFLIKFSSATASCVAYMDVGKGREHAYRDVGGRATQDAVAEDAVALL